MRTLSKLGLAAAVLAGVGLAVWKWLLPYRVEEPAYEVLEERGALEVRRYGPRLVAETLVEGEFRASLNEGFRRLARFIFGGNSGGRSIAMTAPVDHERAGERIAMTAPVDHEREDGAWKVTFTMPSAYTLETLPQPRDPRVRVREVPARQVAALRFSGWVSEEEAAERKREAQAQLARLGLQAAGEPRLAQYDPPWVLPFLRRNEILIDLQR